MTVHKIVVTGGPCGGKTTALSCIDNVFSEKGYKVMFVPEAATILIANGLGPREFADFQKMNMRLHLELEKIFDEEAAQITDRDVLIVCDRGLMDDGAYCSKETLRRNLASFGLTEVEARDGYDAVFHLVTAAKGAEEFYTLENNVARQETAEEAAALDDRFLESWSGHPHLKIIDNRHDFESKLAHLINEIAMAIGDKVNYEVEKKFLIEYPDIAYLESLKGCNKVEITQTYLKDDDDEEIRLRKRGIDGDYVYFLTSKRKINDVKRIEKERRISREEYDKTMAQTLEKKQLQKTRYCLAYNSQYFEIDVMPFWNDKAILEIELDHEHDSIDFPPFIKVIEDVTADSSYRSSKLAK